MGSGSEVDAAATVTVAVTWADTTKPLGSGVVAVTYIQGEQIKNVGVLDGRAAGRVVGLDPG